MTLRRLLVRVLPDARCEFPLLAREVRAHLSPRDAAVDRFPERRATEVERFRIREREHDRLRARSPRLHRRARAATASATAATSAATGTDVRRDARAAIEP